MNWAKQTEDMFKTWSESQKTMWDTWLGMMQQGAAAPAQTSAVWKATVETWEQVVKNSLNAQAEWTRIWVEGVTGSGLPKELAEWAQQTHEMTKRWGEAQQQLWESWFDLMKKVDPAHMPEDWENESQKVFKSWQESTQKIMETQAEWVRRWSAVAQDAQAQADNSQV